MQRKKKQRVRDRWQVALYVPRELVKLLRAEAHKRDRAYSATVIEILRQYFDQKAVEDRIAQKIDHQFKEVDAAPATAQHDSHV